MFRIYTTTKPHYISSRSSSAEPIDTRIDGCPSGGIKAIDFRREHGLADAPNDIFSFLIDTTSESVCRRFADLLDSDSDLVFNASGNGGGGGLDVYRADRISPATAAALHQPASEAAILLLISDLMARLAVRDEEDLQKEADGAAAKTAQIAANRAKYEAFLADPGQIIRERGTKAADTPSSYALRYSFSGANDLTEDELEELIAAANRIVAEEKTIRNAKANERAARLRLQLDAKAAEIGGIFAERHLAGFTVDEEIIRAIQADDLAARGLSAHAPMFGRENVGPWEKPLSNEQFIELKDFKARLPEDATVTLRNAWDEDEDEDVIAGTDMLYAKAVYKVGEVTVTARHDLGAVPEVSTLN